MVYEIKKGFSIPPIEEIYKVEDFKDDYQNMKDVWPVINKRKETHFMTGVQYD